GLTIASLQEANARQAAVGRPRILPRSGARLSGIESRQNAEASRFGLEQFDLFDGIAKEIEGRARRFAENGGKFGRQLQDPSMNRERRERNAAELLPPFEIIARPWSGLDSQDASGAREEDKLFRLMPGRWRPNLTAVLQALGARHNQEQERERRGQAHGGMTAYGLKIERAAGFGARHAAGDDEGVAVVQFSEPVGAPFGAERSRREDGGESNGAPAETQDTPHGSPSLRVKHGITAGGGFESAAAFGCHPEIFAGRAAGFGFRGCFPIGADEFGFGEAAQGGINGAAGEAGGLHDFEAVTAPVVDGAKNDRGDKGKSGLAHLGSEYRILHSLSRRGSGEAVAKSARCFLRGLKTS